MRWAEIALAGALCLVWVFIAIPAIAITPLVIGAVWRAIKGTSRE